LFKKKRPVKFHPVGKLVLPFEFLSKELVADYSSMQKEMEGVL
jgi:hypothetical protein